ncbi:MAG: Ldh family oxidoreductase [Myxococcales bacterium]|nr:Ldh family oxidoreductase [Myxococcales bacterium]
MRVDAHRLTEMASELLVRAGADEGEAQSLAEVLVWCDEVGRSSQGLSRLPILAERLERGLFSTPCRPDLRRVAPGLSVLDGDNGLGHVVARAGMVHAIELAREAGVGAVTVHNANFFGAGAYYVEQAAQQRMLGLAVSNSFPKVAAHGGVKSILGTNPFAFGAPRANGESFLLDMATAAGAGSMIRKYAEQGRELPEGIAVDGQGAAITDPNRVEQGTLLPFGGAKGFGLALMIEILAGVISGAGIGPGVKSMYKNFDEGGNNGFLLVAIDIAKLLPLELYHARMEELIALTKTSANGIPGLEVLYPGQSRWRIRRETDALGVELEERTHSSLRELCVKFGVAACWTPN